MELNTLQLLQIMKNHPSTSPYFIGVFARDRLPRKLRYPCCFIVNTQKAMEPGEHWLGVFYSSFREAEFFDSYGKPPEYYNLTSYLRTTSSSIVHNKKQIQSPFSPFCGHYCCFYLISRCKSIPMKKFLDYFSSNTVVNDVELEKMIKILL